MKLSVINIKIYEIRGQSVILDFDLAALHGYGDKNVKPNY